MCPTLEEAWAHIHTAWISITLQAHQDCQKWICSDLFQCQEWGTSAQPVISFSFILCLSCMCHAYEWSCKKKINKSSLVVKKTLAPIKHFEDIEQMMHPHTRLNWQVHYIYISISMKCGKVHSAPFLSSFSTSFLNQPLRSQTPSCLTRSPGAGRTGI